MSKDLFNLSEVSGGLGAEQIHELTKVDSEGVETLSFAEIRNLYGTFCSLGATHMDGNEVRDLAHSIIATS